MRRWPAAQAFLPAAALGQWAVSARMAASSGGLAEFERELIRARTGEGRKRAKDRGVKFGRPRKMTPHQRQEALQRLREGETMADVARTYNVDAATIGRLAAASPFEHGAAALQ
jgi:DNA invertase Pin-like site-specific DNA recombinase